MQSKQSPKKKDEQWFANRMLNYKIGKNNISYVKAISQSQDNIALDEEDFNIIQAYHSITLDKNLSMKTRPLRCHHHK